MNKHSVFLGAFLALCVTLSAGFFAERAAVQIQHTAAALTARSTDSAVHYIFTEEDLLDIAGSKKHLSGDYVLAADITLTRPWTPIGSLRHPFTGTFNGNGHVIYGLTAQKRDMAMFGAARGAVIQNVVLERASFQSFFPIAGVSWDTRIEGCSINAPRRGSGEETEALPEGAEAL